MDSSAKQTPLVRQGWLRVILFSITFLLLFIFGGGLYVLLSKRLDLSEETQFFCSFLVSFPLSMLCVYFFRRAVDRRSFVSLGFRLRDHRRDALIGLLLAIVLLGIESLILYFTGHLTFTGINFQPVDLLSGFIIMVVVAVGEEAVFRGYILHNLMHSMNRWIALAITSLLFALFHAGNPNITILALVNIFLSGFVMGLNYVYTGNLWFAILFHFSWNFFLGPVLGYEVSGLPLSSLLEQEIEGAWWITGGDFGLEGSVIDGAMSVITFALLLKPMHQLAKSSGLFNFSETKTIQV